MTLMAIADTPHSIALGSAIGIFFGFTPLYPLKTLLSIAVENGLSGELVVFNALSPRQRTARACRRLPSSLCAVGAKQLVLFLTCSRSRLRIRTRRLTCCRSRAFMHLPHRFLIIFLTIVASASALRSVAAAQAYVIADAQTGYILEEQEPRKKLQVGSLTKVATASVVLDWAE